MNRFDGAVAIVTGGASGIGRALAQALTAHGSTVVIADINETLMAETVQQIREAGGSAEGRTLDVTDADAVQALIVSVKTDFGKIDYLFNNAGIAMFGEVCDLSLDDWRRTLEIDLHGVIYGVMAAYPIMIEQGFGHIVNTASLAGLTPIGGLAPYVTAKHGVVGLSTSLRPEAALHGVKVSVVCPGIIDTPLKQTAERRGLDWDKMLTDIPQSLQNYPPEKCAEVILRGVQKNKAMIIVTWQAAIAWRFYRFFPGLAHWLSKPAARWLRKTFKQSPT